MYFDQSKFIPWETVHKNNYSLLSDVQYKILLWKNKKAMDFYKDDLSNNFQNFR